MADVAASHVDTAPARSAAQRVAAIGVAIGGLLIIAGWFLPWGTAGAGSVSGLSDVIQFWFRALILVTGIIALSGDVALRKPHARWLFLGNAIVAVGWSLIFPSTVYLGARTLAGHAGAPAASGPGVTYQVGAFATALGVVVIAASSGPAVTGRRWAWVVGRDSGRGRRCPPGRRGGLTRARERRVG